MGGICKLCLRDGQELQDSHLVPAGSYGRIRDNNLKIPDPAVINTRIAIQSSKQIKAPLLCWDCEQRFNDRGERWFLQNCWHEDRFPLREVLRNSGKMVLAEPTHQEYATSLIPEVNVSALTYFPTSVFWRSSVINWFDRKSDKPTLELPHSEECRRYLMDEGPFPNEYALLVSVALHDGIYLRSVFTPHEMEEHEGCRLFSFPILGVVFGLLVGTSIPVAYRNMCIVRSPGSLVRITDQADTWTKNAARFLLKKAKNKVQTVR